MTDQTNSASGPADTLEFFWRPGCGFCMMLERDLQRVGITFVKRNIWEEPEAAAIVRSVADGNETVPTVRLGGQALVNPPVDRVAAMVEQAAPHLLQQP